MSELWGPIDASEWRTVPAISGRVATRADVESGMAAFYIEGPSSSHPMQLPCCAIQNIEDGSQLQVIAIQAEACPEIVVGVRYLGGGNGVCTLAALDLLPGGFGND
jgi:hypothetical protein